MRLKSELWVKAYIRQCFGADAPAVVARRGYEDAGVIFIRIQRLNGTSDLYGPAPAGYEGADSERTWVLLLVQKPDAEVDTRLESEARLDSDIWVVEVEDRQGRNFLDGWLAKP